MRSISRKKMYICILAAVILSLAMPLTSFAATASATIPLNVRSGPTVDHEVVAVLNAGDSVTMGEQSGNWCKVTLPNGTTGWASMTYLNKTTSFGTATVVTPSIPAVTSTATVKATAKPAVVSSGQAQQAAVCVAASLNLREGPDVIYEVIGNITYNEQVILLETGSEWHKVQKGSIVGWASADFLSITGEVEPALGPTFQDNGGVFKKLTGDTDYMILINKETQVGSVLKKDLSGYYTVPIRNFAVSTGKSGSSTPSGIFTVYGSHRWRLMKGDVYCQYLLRFDTHLLTHSLTYSRRNPATMSYTAYNNLGTAASSGCVRMRTVDAKWLYDNCEMGTYVQIVDGGETVAGIPSEVVYEKLPGGVRWDPTDPTEGNPYYGMYQ